jgi:DivIVA domain-containing protein
MREILLLLVVALVAAAIVFGVIVAITGAARGLQPAEPDERARRLPGDRPLAERDLGAVRFDAVVRGYRMAQVDAALRRVSYDLGYKQELIAALEAEVAALRDGRTADADLLRDRRLAAAAPVRPAAQRPTGDATAAPAHEAAAAAPTANAAPTEDPVPAENPAPAEDPVPAGDSGPVGEAGPVGDPGHAAGAEPEDGAEGAGPAEVADVAEPATDAVAAEADGSAGAAATADDEAGDSAAEKSDTGGSNGRADGAARRVADQPAVS